MHRSWLFFTLLVHMQTVSIPYLSHGFGAFYYALLTSNSNNFLAGFSGISILKQSSPPSTLLGKNTFLLMSIMPTMLQGLAPCQMLNNSDMGLILFPLGCCVWMCMCMFVYACVWERESEYIHVQICVEAKGQLQMPFLIHDPPCFILTWPGAH